MRKFCLCFDVENAFMNSVEAKCVRKLHACPELGNYSALDRQFSPIMDFRGKLIAIHVFFFDTLL